MSISAILEQLANEPKTKAKLQILVDNYDNELLKKVFTYTLTPSINYYIKKIPTYCVTNTPSLTLDEAIDKLGKLIDRTYTGHAGIEHLVNILQNVSSDDADVISKIIKRDLRCGANTASVNKVWKDLIPEYPYMRCSSLKGSDIKKMNWKKGVISQLKADGRYNNANKIDGNDIQLVSRSGIPIPNHKVQNIIDVIQKYFPDDSQTHGEILVRRNGVILEREIGNGIINSVVKGGEFEPGDEAVYFVWDQIPLSQSTPNNKYHVSYSDRLAKLKEHCAAIPEDEKCIEIIETRIVHTVEEAIEHFQEMLLLGLEGTVLKDPDAIWEDTTSKKQIKLKLVVDDIDLEFVQFNPGTGKNASTFGSMLLKSGDELLEVNITGLADKLRKELFEADDLKIITIKANAVMAAKTSGKKASLFLPRFKCTRDDKTTADTLQEIQDKFESAIENIKQCF